MSVCPHCGQPMPAATLSERLAAWRKNNGLPLEDVADKVGLSPITLGAIERGAFKTTPAYEQRIETILATKEQPQ